MNNTKNLTISALAIALVLVSFTLFKGTTNLFNAILVPLILAIMVYRIPVKQRFITLFTAYIIVMLLFPTQIIYMFVYIGLALILINSNRNSTNITWIIRIIGFALVLFIATYISDYMFKLEINAFVYNLTQGRLLFFIGFYIIESIIILISVSFMFRRIIRILHLDNS